jgi:two-component system, chemotaxis family, protein-glutamate methylesterase/glutaminase
VAERIRVLVVDDSAFIRHAVQRMLETGGDIEIVGFAANGIEAVERVKELHPHVVILDVNMPSMDGMEALQRIMAEAPTAVLMLSSLTAEGADTTLLALDLGAVDFVDKTTAGTTMDIYSLAPVLREKVLAVAGAAIPQRAADAEPEPAPEVGWELPATSPYEVLVIGVSTGGPRALVEVLSRMPPDFPTGIIVAQHMPPGFTGTLAERLDRRSRLEVVEARDLDEVRRGRVLLAPGGKQISVERSGGKLVVRIDEGPSNLLHRPSVDLLLRSVVGAVGSRAIGLILTGMGDDGARGLRALRDAGGRTLAESAETAVIYGMPRAAAEAAERVLPLREIAPALARLAVRDPDPKGLT